MWVCKFLQKRHKGEKGWFEDWQSESNVRYAIEGFDAKKWKM